MVSLSQDKANYPSISGFTINRLVEKTASHFRFKAIPEGSREEVLLTLATAQAYRTTLKEVVASSFEATVEKVQSINHPNLLPVLGSGFYDEMPYSYTPFVDGSTLRSWIGKTQNWHEAFRLMMPVVGALEAIHAQGLLHRDLQPDNIYYDPYLGVKLANCSLINASIDQKQSLTLTGVGEIKPAYTAPEVWKGEASVLSDQYSLGVVLYELLTGTLPFEADNVVSLLILQTSKPNQVPSQLLPGLPSIIDAFVLKMLSPEPSQRFENIALVKHAMQEMLNSNKLKVLSTVPKKAPVTPPPMPEPAPYQPTSIVDFNDLRQDAEQKLAQDVKQAEKRAKSKSSGGVGGCGALFLILLLLVLVTAVVFLVGLMLEVEFFIDLADQIEVWVVNNEFLQQFLP